MRCHVLFGLSFVTVAASCLFGCSAEDSSSQTNDQQMVTGGAEKGQACGEGLFGTPKISCAEGLVCKYGPNGTAPQGPDGSSSASMGTCEEPGAGKGEVCGNGVFGAPKIDCADGLVCKYGPNGTAPQGPDGSSSASTGTCQPAGAAKGEVCGDGFFGAPKVDCADGLVCKYGPNGTAPQGPDGSSSATTGTCQPDGAGEGEACGDGVFGAPKIDCADGLVCKYGPNGTAPQGPDGSSSASTGTCVKAE